MFLCIPGRKIREASRECDGSFPDEARHGVDLSDVCGQLAFNCLHSRAGGWLWQLQTQMVAFISKEFSAA